MNTLSQLCMLINVWGGVLAAPQTAHDATTLTYTATTTATAVSTVTGNSTVYTTTTYTRPGVFPVYNYIYNETITTTYTTTEEAGTLVTPSSIVSAPTPPGFTPLLQESPYTDPLTILRTTTTTTSTSTYDPSPTTLPGNFVQVYGTFVTLTTTAPSYVVESATVTTTTTSAPAVYTKYDACGSDNLATRIPTGQFIDGIGEYGEEGYDVLFTANAEDCCGYCQGLGTCFGGSWETGPYADFPGRCFVFTINTQENQTCDGSITSYGTFSHEAGSTNGHGVTAFNGPCGSLDWSLTDVDYFG